MSKLRSFFVFAGLVLLLAAFSSNCFAASLAEDPDLAKPITLSVKGEALSDICQSLSATTGVKLRTSKEVADQKATILVTDKPLCDIMSAIATLFNYKWSVDTTSDVRSYTLVYSNEDRRKKEAEHARTIDQAFEDIDKQINAMVQYTGKSREELREMRDDALNRIESEMDIAMDGNTEPTKKQLEKAMEFYQQIAPLINISENSYASPLIKLYQSMSPQVINSLKSGSSVEICYSSRTNEGEWRIPDSILNEFISCWQSDQQDQQRMMEEAEARAEENGVTIDESDEYANDSSEEVQEEQEPSADDEYTGDESEEIDNEEDVDSEEAQRQYYDSYTLANPEWVSISFTCENTEQIIFLNAKIVMGGTSINGNQTANPVRGMPLASIPLMNDENIAALYELGNAKYKELDKKVSITADDVVKYAELPWQESSGQQIMANRSDILAILHDKVGVDVAADHYSIWLPYQAFGEMTINDVLNQYPLLAARSSFEKNILRLRNIEFAVSDMAEVPNRLIRQWREEYQKTESMDLDILGSIANLLTEDQYNGLAATSRYLGLGMISGDNYDSFKFYGSLSSNQKKKLSNGGIDARALSSEQFTLLTALTDSYDNAYSNLINNRVGIYRDNIRIDKPQQSDLSSDICSVSLQIDSIEKSFDYNEVLNYEYSDGDELEYLDLYDASSAEEAWKKVIAKYPNASKNDLTCIDTTHYTLIVQHNTAEGKDAEETMDYAEMSVNTCRPYSQVEKMEQVQQ